MLVDIGSVAVPGKFPSLAPQPQYARGSAWRFTEQGVAPYEFAYDIASRPDIGSFQPFLSELGALLDRLGLTEKLGICALTREDQVATTQVEFTQGRANFNLPFDIAPQDGPNQSIEAVWQFHLPPGSGTRILATESTPSPLILKKCKVACQTGPNTGHQGRHLTTKQ